MNVHKTDDHSIVPRAFDMQRMTTRDGTKLAYRHWPCAPGMKAKGAIVLFHRGHEHGGRLAHLVDELGMTDFAFFAWDARGHGKSDGIRGCLLYTSDAADE